MKLLLLVFCLFLSLGFLFADDEVKSEVAKKETVNFKDALEKAGLEEKPVLMLLLSKFCPECDLFKQKILTDEKFKAFTDHFVVKFILEYPYEDPKQSEANLALGRIYTSLVFPSLVLLDANGLPADRFYFKDETVEAFIAAIELKIKRMKLKKQFLATKENSEKDQIVKEYFSNKVNGENLMFFEDIIVYQSIENKSILTSERLKPLIAIKEKFHSAKSIIEKKSLAFELISNKIPKDEQRFFADLIAFAFLQKKTPLVDENMNKLNRLYLRGEDVKVMFLGSNVDDQEMAALCNRGETGRPVEFLEILKEKFEIEDVYSKNLCKGGRGPEYLLVYAQREGGDKGNYFIKKFLIYLNEREKLTGDSALCYRILNYSVNTTTSPPKTLLDDIISFDASANTEIIPTLIKHGARRYKDLTEEDKKMVYEYPLTKKDK